MYEYMYFALTETFLYTAHVTVKRWRCKSLYSEVSGHYLLQLIIRTVTVQKKSLWLVYINSVNCASDGRVTKKLHMNSVTVQHMLSRTCIAAVEHLWQVALPWQQDHIVLTAVCFAAVIRNATSMTDSVHSRTIYTGC
jgi:hypothetical protein